MKKKRLKSQLTLRALALLASLVLAPTAQASLLARDLDHDTVTDAFYDTDRNITWLRNANVNGVMTFTQANAWAQAYSLGGYSGWRLPTTPNFDPRCFYPPSNYTGYHGFNCSESEMGHLWYTELGNIGDGSLIANTGDFLNLESTFGQGGYLSGSHRLNTSLIYGFSMEYGKQYLYLPGDYGFAIAVHDGDLGAPLSQVPEPGSALLTLGGLLSLGLVRRRNALRLMSPHS